MQRGKSREVEHDDYLRSTRIAKVASGSLSLMTEAAPVHPEAFSLTGRSDSISASAIWLQSQAQANFLMADLIVANAGC